MTGTVKGEMAYQPKTKNGYDFFEVSSALQKAIRRCDEEQALYWMVELFISGNGEYCWKRLKIMVSEDIGLAEPNLPAQIYALYEMYEDQIKKSDGKHFPERLFLTHAVLLMARAKKSRLVDWTVISAWDGHDLVHLDIPDYAFDRHNMKGRKMGRGWDHFFDVASHLENMADIEGEEERKEQARTMRGGKAASYMGPVDQDPMF